MGNANGWGDGSVTNNIGWGKGADNAIGWGDIHADSWAGLTDIVGVTAPSLLLDTYINAAVAYSLRKLRTAYTGSSIRVRRSSDNAEQDIAFSGNDLDTTSLLDFVGYNLLTYSEDITQQLIGGGRATYTNNVEVSPDSNLTGGKFATDGTFGEHYWFRNAITILNSTSYNISVYLKQAEFTKVRVSSNISGAAQNCDVDLTNGAISNNGFANTPIVTAEANGWYRFSVTITSGTTSASPISIRLYNTSGAINFVGDAGKGIYVWGTQLSQISTVKTYQKTVATAGGNGFVSIWYDQSTNVNNSIQTSPTSQAQVVLNGNLRLDPNNNKVSTQWTTDAYSLTSNITIAQNFLLITTLNRAATNNLLIPMGTNVSTTPAFYWDNTGNIRSQISTPLLTHLASDTTVGDYIISYLRDNSNNVKAFRNGTTLTSGINSGTTAVLTRFGQGIGASGSTGWFQELIYWNTNLESSRSAIETAINTYYSVY